jgi:predicted DNA-binding transcriptional regulator YafY
VGVTRRNDSEEMVVQFRVKLRRAYYVETKPIHSTQKKVNRDESIPFRTFEITVIPNNELIQQFLSFGADLEVVAPPVIREQIAEHYRKGAAFYTEQIVKMKAQKVTEKATKTTKKAKITTKKATVKKNAV